MKRRELFKLLGGAGLVMALNPMSLFAAETSDDDLLTGQDRLLKMFLSKQEGRIKLAKALTDSMRRRADYKGIARRTLRRTDNFDLKNPNSDNIYYVGESACDVMRTRNLEFTLPTFVISTTYTFPFTWVKDNLGEIRRGFNQTKDAIIASEDSFLYALLDSGNLGRGYPIGPSATLYRDLNKTHFGYLTSGAWDGRDVEPVAHVMTHVTYTNKLAKHEHQEPESFFLPNCQRKQLQTGNMASIHLDGTLADVLCTDNRSMRDGYIHTLALPRDGAKDAADLVFAEKRKLTVWSADRPDLRRVGFTFEEEIGLAVNERNYVTSIPVDKVVRTKFGETKGDWHLQAL